MLRLRISLPRQLRRSEIHIGQDIRLNLGQLIQAQFTSSPRSLCIVSNERVFGIYGEDVVRALKHSGFRVTSWLLPEGERYKSFRTLERTVAFLAENKFERGDAVVALGGGVVGDIAGFAASIYLRGIPVIQLPTTLLAQIDSSVGGKTGINLPVGKNLAGSFHQPELVVIDTATLSSLPSRELVSGFCEMLKQSIVASKSLFQRTVLYLDSKEKRNKDFGTTAFQKLIRDHCKFKSSIVANDERESTSRVDSKSRRILNFGHTTAHALENVTNYRYFRHGEAVGYGILVASEISNNLGLLSNADLDAIRHAVNLCGPLPAANHLNPQAIMQAMKHDKKNVGGETNWILVEGIGLPRVVKGAAISTTLLRQALKDGLHNPRKESAH